MPDNKVESYKIDPELKKKVKKYKKAAFMSDKLKSQLVIEQTKLQQLAKALYGTEQVKEQMLKMMNPQSKDFEQPIAPENLKIEY